MNPEERSLLERVLRISEENQAMLKSIRRASHIGLAMRIIYWVLILGLSFGAFYFIQPYVDSVMSALGGDVTTDAVKIQNPYQNYVDNIQSIIK